MTKIVLIGIFGRAQTHYPWELNRLRSNVDLCINKELKEKEAEKNTARLKNKAKHGRFLRDMDKDSNFRKTDKHEAWSWMMKGDLKKKERKLLFVLLKVKC